MYISMEYAKHIVEHTVKGKVEQLWQVLATAIGVTRIRKAGVGIPQLIEERVNHRLDRRETLSRSVFKQLGDQIDGVGVSLPKDLETISTDTMVPRGSDKDSPC